VGLAASSDAGTAAGATIRRTEFSDDRLEIVLRRLSQTAAWEALETDLWQATVDVYNLK
jgi:hypothetical protein